MFSLGRAIALKENGRVHSCTFKTRANLSDLVETERLKFAYQGLRHLFVQARLLSQYCWLLHAQCRSFFALGGEEKNRTTSDQRRARATLHNCASACLSLPRKMSKKAGFNHASCASALASGLVLGRMYYGGRWITAQCGPKRAWSF